MTSVGWCAVSVRLCLRVSGDSSSTWHWSLDTSSDGCVSIAAWRVPVDGDWLCAYAVRNAPATSTLSSWAYQQSTQTTGTSVVSQWSQLMHNKLFVSVLSVLNVYTPSQSHVIASESYDHQSNTFTITDSRRRRLSAAVVCYQPLTEFCTHWQLTLALSHITLHYLPVKLTCLNNRCNKKAQLSLTNPRDACEKFARFT